MLRQAWMLLRRELTASRTGLFAFAGVIVLWNLVLWTQLGRWDRFHLEALSLGSLFVTPLWVVIASLQSWSREWVRGSAHYTLAFPVSGWMLVATKATAAVAQALIAGLFAAAAGLPLLNRLVGFGSFWHLRQAVVINVVKITLVIVVYMFVASAIVQLAYLAARATRASGSVAGLVTPVTGIAAIWLLLRAGGLLNGALDWLPPVAFYTVLPVGDVYYFMGDYVRVGPVFTAAVTGLVYFTITGWLTERGADV